MLVLYFLLCIAVCQTYTLHTVLWATDNIMFKNVTVANLKVNMGDEVDFLCPQLATVKHAATNLNQEIKFMKSFSIFQVPEEALYSCNMTSSRLVFKCHRPYTRRRYTFTVMRFNAIPGGMEFACDTKYYFVAKETGTDTENQMCKTYNARMTLNVRCWEPEISQVMESSERPSPTISRPTQPTTTSGSQHKLPRSLSTETPRKTPVSDDDGQVLMVVLTCVGSFVILVCVILVVVCFLWRRRKVSKQDNQEARPKQRYTSNRRAVEIVRNGLDATAEPTVLSSEVANSDNSISIISSDSAYNSALSEVDHTNCVHDVDNYSEENVYEDLDIVSDSSEHLTPPQVTSQYAGEGQRSIIFNVEYEDRLV